MRFQCTQPAWLWLLPPAVGWTLWLAWSTQASLAPWRRWVSTVLRAILVAALTLALAGLRWERPDEGMTAYFLLDRSESIPPAQQEQSRADAAAWVRAKEPRDQDGLIVFGADAALESAASEAANAEKIQAVVNPDRTDIAGAIRLGAAAFPERGQKKLVLFTDGNENEGDALGAVAAARSQGITVDVAPLGARRGGDVAVDKLSLPSHLAKGQSFELKIIASSDQSRPAKLKVYRDDQLMGEQAVQLDAGKNLFALPQTLDQAGFHTYEARIEAPGDEIPQNNKASGFVAVREGRNALVLSSDPAADAPLAAALRAKLKVKVADVRGFPDTLAELQSYDVIFLCNVAAGDLGRDRMRLLDSAVKDFGAGLVCLGGDQAFAAGGYRKTPLEDLLPVEMELSSKKVLPKGALGLVMHGMEFANGNQVARQVALGALESLGPQDEMGVWLWDGNDRALFDLQAVGEKTRLAALIAGMNQGDLPGFEGLMQMASKSLQRSSANLKHLIVLSDGDPNAPSAALMSELSGHRVTVSTVMIGGHVQPTTMQKMAADGGGRFYEVRSAAQLPQIFIKEASVILKSAIIEEAFTPKVTAVTEPIRGIGAFPPLLGYVATTLKPRAELPLQTDKGDPLMAHWQYGLGRSMAFTSDARAKWAPGWLAWGQFQQFWDQAASWALRRVDAANFNAEVSVDRGQGSISVEALDPEGNYRNFLDLQAAVVSPTGGREMVTLAQTGPGRYEAKFGAREVGAYLLDLREMKGGAAVASQVVGASVNYSPEFNDSGPNLSLLRRLAEAGGGRLLDRDADNPFKIGRVKTYQPRDLWEDLLRWLVVLFLADIAVRRVDFDREEWAVWWSAVRAALGFGDARAAAAGQASMETLLSAARGKRETRPAAEPLRPFPTPTAVPPPQAAPPPAAVARPSAAAAAAESGVGAGPPGEPADPRQRLLEAKRRAQRRR